MGNLSKHAVPAPVNIDSLFWNTAAMCSIKQSKRDQRFKYFFRYAQRCTVMGGAEMRIKSKDESSLTDALNVNRMKGAWSPHETGRYGMMVAYHPHKLPPNTGAHIFEVDKGMVIGAAFGPCSAGEEAHRTCPNKPYLADSYERFINYSPELPYSHIVLYVYLKSQDDKWQRDQIIALGAALREIEKKNPNAVILLSGDWNLALSKNDTMHKNKTETAFMPKAKVSPNASIFRSQIGNRYTDIFQPLDTLSAKTRNYFGRNDRSYTPYPPAMHLLGYFQSSSRPASPMG